MKACNEFPRTVPVVHREKHLSSNGPCTLVYGDEDGKIRIGCSFGEAAYTVYDLELVPSTVADQGKEAVRSFALDKVEELVESFHAHETLRKKRIVELKAAYQIDVDGVTVKGVVTTHSTGGRTGQLKVVMTEPYKLECYIHIRPSCFAEAMGQRRTFDDDGNLLPQEVERHIEVLGRWYKKELHLRTKPPEHPTLKAFAVKS